ncbi:hypothetical protein [Allomesorhizobium alhagi]|uniref:Uncharacterized protein n=1 Tax=Mesorhizobium alhagi CCNWXJ12-2 TaxID=1107882 RepID=H0I0G0_9HYPH|nr:hypothetical protein [Mesorhizobium alhagi]EHK53548.1 hypothetical protein MAXJ12_29692 [Mesorhizobium alhagi CCNWXJ12-2]
MTDVTFAVSERAFKAAFNKAYPSLPSLPFDGSNTVLGLVWYGVEGAIHIEGAGDIDFEDGNTFLVSELDIGWDKLILRFGFDIPPIKIGGFCLIRMPEDSWFFPGECILPFPGTTIFTGAPDIGPITLNLNAIIPYVVSEVSGRYKIGIRKETDAISGKSYQRIYADPEAIDVDPISINDTLGKLPTIVKAGVAVASAQMLAFLPQAWMVDVVLSFLGVPTVTAYLLDLLDIHDDMEEWLMDVLNVSIGVDNLLMQLILDDMLKKDAVFEIEDPYPFVPAGKIDVADFGGFPVPPATPEVEHPAIAASILNASAEFDEDNMFVRFDFGP